MIKRTHYEQTMTTLYRHRFVTCQIPSGRPGNPGSGVYTPTKLIYILPDDSGLFGGPDRTRNQLLGKPRRRIAHDRTGHDGPAAARAGGGGDQAGLAGESA